MLRGANASTVTIAGLRGAVVNPGAASLLSATGGGGGESLFCDGPVRRVGRWETDQQGVPRLWLKLCADASMQANVTYGFSAEVRNPAEAQSAPSVSISAEGTFTAAPVEMEPSNATLLGVSNGGAPLMVIVPEFIERRIGQRTPLSRQENTISMTLTPNVDLAAADGSAVTISGLPGEEHPPNQPVNFRALSPGEGAAGLIGPAPPPAITVDAAMFDAARGVMILYIFRGQRMRAGVRYVLAFNVTNVATTRESPRIEVSASGTAAFRPMLVSKPHVPRYGVPNGGDPFLVHVARWTRKGIDQETPLDSTNNTITLVLQPTFAMLGDDGSRLTLAPLTGLDAFGRARFALRGEAPCTELGNLIGECQQFEQLFCAGEDQESAAAEWVAADEALVISLCRGSILQRGQRVMLSFDFGNPGIQQHSPDVQLKSSGRSFESLDNLDKSGAAAMRVPRGSDPLMVVAVIKFHDVDQTEAPTKGGTNLTVYGTHLWKGPGVYRCRFTARGTTVESLARMETLGGQTVLRCTVPPWPSYEAVTELTLSHDDTAPLPKNTRGGITADGVLYVVEDAGVPHRVLLFQGWDGIAEESPVIGSAEGGRVLTVTGFGFNAGRHYECVFSSGGEQARTGATVRALSKLSCATPPWGAGLAVDTGARGAAVLTIEAADPGAPSLAAGGRVRFTNGGLLGVSQADCGALCFPGRCSFRYTPVWVSDSWTRELQVLPESGPRVFSGAGGQTISVSGLGFSTETEFWCQFDFHYGTEHYTVRSAFPADVISPNLLTCVAPTWEHRAVGDAIFSLHMARMTSAQGCCEESDSSCSCAPELCGDFEMHEALFNPPLQVEFVEFYSSLATTTGSSRGGFVVTVQGLGFNTATAYMAAVTGAAGYAEVTVLSHSEAAFTMPLVPGPSAVQHVRLLFGDSLLPLRLLPNWPESLEEAENLQFQFQNEWVMLQPSFVDPKYHRVTVFGAGFDAQRDYTCVFSGTSTESLQNGAALSYSVTASVSSDALKLVCDAPPWTLSPAESVGSLPSGTWVYTDTSAEQPVGVAVLVDSEPMGSSARTDASLVLVHINRKPDFALSYTEVHWDENGGLRTLPVASSIVPGVRTDGTPEPSEMLQQYTFTVETDLEELFLWSKRPYLQADGTLTFQPALDRTGVATLRITLRDDGDSQHGGFSVSDVRKLFVVIDPHGQAPKFDTDRTVVNVPENAGAVTLPFFVRNVAEHDAYEQLAQLQITIEPQKEVDLDYFIAAPALERGGDLTFEPGPFRFGNASFVVRVTAIDSAAHEQHSTIKNLTISISPVNQPPTLALTGISTVRIESSVSGDIAVSGLIASYIPGASTFSESGPRGEDWAEAAQNLSFSLEVVQVRGTFPFIDIPSFEAFVDVTDSVAPVVHLSPLVAHGNGEIDFNLTLRDSEGLASPPETFTVEVQAVNDEPVWALASGEQVQLPQALQEGDSHCAEFGGSTCTLLLQVDENCRDCVPAASGVDCARGFWAADLLRAKPSLYDSGDEAGQALTFQVTPLSGDMGLFASTFPQPVVAANGSLFFCLAEDQNGEATFQVQLHDDGGTERDGVDASAIGTLTIRVLAVNQAPSFELFSANLRFWSSWSSQHDLSRHLDSFATEILKGNWDEAGGFDREGSQSITFEISGADSALFSAAPAVNTSGYLSVSVVPAKTGTATLGVSLFDDGGSYGANRSAEREVLVAVGDSYVIADLTMSGMQVDLDFQEWLQGSIVFIASWLSIPETWVTVREASTSASEWRVKLDIFALNATMAIRYLGEEDSLVTAAQESLGILTTSEFRAFRKNYRNVPAASVRLEAGNDTQIFSTNAYGLLISMQEAELASPMPLQTLKGLIYDTLAPEDTPLAADGTEDLRWDVRTLGHRLFLDEEWTWDGSDGGLMESVPTVNAECAPLCRSASLSFAQRPYWNGEALYELRMPGTFVRYNVTLKVTAVNQRPTLEVAGLLSVAEQQVEATVVLVNAAFGARSGPDVLDEVAQELSIQLVGVTEIPNNGSTALLRAPPILALSGDTASISLELGAHANGYVHLSVVLRDDGPQALDSLVHNLSVAILVVNDEPVWGPGQLGAGDQELASSLDIEVSPECTGFGSGMRIPGCNLKVTILENCDDCVPAASGVDCARGFWAADLLRAKPSLYDSGDEAGQALTFQVTPLSGDMGLFASTFPQPVVAANGSLFFCLAEDQNGEATFQVQLHDDGGTERDGVDASAIGTLTIRVLAVNQAPSFEVCCDGELTFWAVSSPLAQRNRVQSGLARSILMGNWDEAGGFDREGFQTASFFVFSETGIEFLDTTPLVDDSGDMALTLVPHRAGTAKLDIVLVDDGGEATERDWSSIPLSEPLTLGVTVLEGFVRVTVAAYTALLPVNASYAKKQARALLLSRLRPAMDSYLRAAPTRHEQHGGREALVMEFETPAVTALEAAGMVAEAPGIAVALQDMWGEAVCNEVLTAVAFRRNLGSIPQARLRSNLQLEVTVETIREAPGSAFDTPEDFETPESGWTEPEWTVVHGEPEIVDDGFVALPPLGFPFCIEGVDVSETVFVSSNSFISFGAGFESYNELSAFWPPVPTLFIGAADNLATAIALRVVSDEARRGVEIRFEGKANTWLFEDDDEEGGPIVWSATLWDDNSIAVSVNGQVHFHHDALYAFSDGAGFLFAAGLPLAEGYQTTVLHIPPICDALQPAEASQSEDPAHYPDIYADGSGVVVQALEGDAIAVEISGFVRSMLAPENSSMALDGREQVFWDMSPLGHRLFLREEWTMDGSDGGLFAAAPVVLSDCAPICVSATLSFESRSYWNGKVLYELRMRGTDITYPVTVDIMSVNQQPTFGVVPTSYILEKEVGLTLDDILLDISAVLPRYPLSEMEDERAQSFVATVNGTGTASCWHSGPCSAISDLSFAVFPHGRGSLTLSTPAGSAGVHSLQALLSDSGGAARGGQDQAAPAAFDVRVVRIDAVAEVWENSQSCLATPCELPGFATDLTGLTHTDGSPLSYHLAIVWNQGEVLEAHVARNGSLFMRIAPDRAGVVEVLITLRAGDAAPPFSWVEQHTQLRVAYRNHPPRFEVMHASLSYAEASTAQEVRSARLVQGAIPGPLTVAQELSQTISFSLTPSVEEAASLAACNDGSSEIDGAPAWDPELLENAVVVPVSQEPGVWELQLITAPDHFGVMLFSLMGVDDGGANVDDGALDKSDPYELCVVIRPVNRAPTFTLEKSERIIMHEGADLAACGDACSALTSAPDAGRREADQILRWRVRPVAAAVPDDALPPRPIDPAALFEDGGAHQLFAAGSVVEMSLAGDLTFTLAPERNGVVLLEVVLLDNGGALNGGRDASEPAYVTLEVLPVNQAPTFVLVAPVLAASERAEDWEFSALVADLVSPGGWGEDLYQKLSFSVEVLTGVRGLVTSETVDLTLPNATLRFAVAAHRFGSARLRLNLTDTGGRDRGGIDSSSQEFDVEITAANDAPSVTLQSRQLVINRGSTCVDDRFPGVSRVEYLAATPAPGAVECSVVWENSSLADELDFYAGKCGAQQHSSQMCSPACSAGDILVQEHVGFITFSLGPYEDGARGCSRAEQRHGACCAVCNQSPGEACGCEQQGGEFSVTAVDSTEAARLFDVQPFVLFPCGVLVFAANRLQSGRADFIITLTDVNPVDGEARTSEPQTFSIVVLNTNFAPRFSLTIPDLVLFEDSQADFIIASGITPDGGAGIEGDQELTFHVIVNGSFFAEDGFPHIDASGRLSLKTAPNVFGNMTAVLRLRDDGGTERGGVDMYELLLSIRVLPLNDAPSFNLTSELRLVEGSGTHDIPRFATSVRAGPPNEADQSVTFFVDSVSYQDLFARQPHIAPDGVLSFELAAGESGAAVVQVRLFDDGDWYPSPDLLDLMVVNGTARARFADAPPQYHNASVAAEFVLHVASVNDAPGFLIPWQVSCLTQSTSAPATCACPNVSSPDVPSAACGLAEGAGSAKDADSLGMAEVMVLENAPAQHIDHFAQQPTPSAGRFRAGKAVFRHAGTRLEPSRANDGFPIMVRVESTPPEWHRLDHEEVLAAPGLEYAADYAWGANFSRLYAVEPHLSCLSVHAPRNDSGLQEWPRAPGPGPATGSGAPTATPAPEVLGLQLVDRYADGQHRLRFDMLSDGHPSQQEGGVRTLNTIEVCAMEEFALGNDPHVIVAAGCQPLSHDANLAPPGEACELAVLAGKACEEPAPGGLIGHWELTGAAIAGELAVAPFSDDGDQAVLFSGVHMSYTRSLVTGICGEQFPLAIGPAVFRDLAEPPLGGAVLVGPGTVCKNSAAWRDWDRETEAQTLSARQFLMSNGAAEAVQFDGAFNKGLFVTDDLTGAFFSGMHPRNVSLPADALTVEAVFSIHAAAATAGTERSFWTAGQFSRTGCHVGVSLGYKQTAETTKVLFRVSTTHGAGVGHDVLEYQLPERLPIGSWHALAATFDGAEVLLFLDGQRLNISLPLAATPRAVLWSEAQLDTPSACRERSPVVLGGGVGVHAGGLYSVKVWGRALSPAELSAVYKATAANALRRLRDADESSDHLELALYHWVRGKAMERFSGQSSPSVNRSLIQSASEEPLTLNARFYGRFRNRAVLTVRYYGPDGTVGDVPATATATTVLAPKNAVYPGGHAETGIGLVNEFGRSIWQRLCFASVCGLSSSIAVRPSQLDVAQSGERSTHVFEVRASVARVLVDTHALVERTTFFTVTDTATHLSGLASVLAFDHHSESYLAVAKQWDGHTTRVTSSVFHLITGRPASQPAAELLHSVRADAARQWARAVLPSGDAALVLAAYAGPTCLYQWGNLTGLDTDTCVPLVARGASGAVGFSAGGSTYVALAMFRDAETLSLAANAKLLRLSQAGPSAPIGAEMVQELPTTAAHGVELLRAGDQIVLLFPAMHPTEPSRVFVALSHLAGSAPFRPAAPVPTRHAVSVRAYWDSGVGAAVAVFAQREAEALMMRWNGSALVGSARNDSLAADYAGGQILEGRNSTSAVLPLAAPGTAHGLLLVASAGGTQPNGDYAGTVLFAPRRTEEDGLAGAADVLVAQRAAEDGGGELVVVAGMFAPGLAAYLWSDAHGALELLGLATCAAPVSAHGPVEYSGWRALALAPAGDLIFAASARDHVVGVFALRGEVGLKCVASLRDGEATGDGRVVDGLGGARGVAVSTNGTLVYVAGHNDAAVAVLSWQPDGFGGGALDFVDRLKQGERLLHLLDDNVSDTVVLVPPPEPTGAIFYDTASGEWLPVPPEPLPFVEPPGLPHRIGGSSAAGDRNAPSWVFNARANVAFSEDGEEYLVTAALGVDADGAAQGAVVLSWWNESSGAWQMVQEELGRDAAPRCLTTFLVEDRDGFAWRFVAVGSAPDDGAPTGDAVQVYRWAQNVTRADARLVHHHVAPVALRGGASTSPASGLPVPTALSVEQLTTFEAGGYTFLAAAVAGAAAAPGAALDTRAMSFVWRWNPLGSTVLADGSVGQGSGFEVFQLLEDCAAAAHVRTMRGAAGPADRVVMACYAAPPAGELVSYVWSPQVQNEVMQARVGRLGVDQRLSVPAPVSSEPLSVAGHDYLMVATNGDWAPANPTPAAAPPAAALTSFCWDASVGKLSAQGDGTCAPIVRAGYGRADLAGILGMKAFEADGEVYLAVGQALCSAAGRAKADFKREACLSQQGAGELEAPRARVLQFNRVRGELGPVAAMTDAASVRDHGIPVPDVELAMHEQDLRPGVGLVAGWEHVHAGGRTMLISASEDRGAVVLEFDFPHVTGLAGAAVLAAANGLDPLLPDRVWVASVVDRALVSLRVDLGLVVQGRSVLLVEAVLSEEPLPLRRHAVPSPPAVGERHARMTAGADAVLGLAGAVALEAPCDGRRYCYPSVVSALERGELECAAFPPWPAPAGAGPHMGNASCQTLSFAVAVAGVDNSRLLSEAPALTLGGELTFAAALFENGAADLAMTITDSGGAVSPATAVTLLVAPVNQAPSFMPQAVVSGQNLPGVQQLLFARNVSAGAAPEDGEQQLSFEFSFTNPQLFSSAPYSGPNLTVATLPSGERVGFVRFVLRAGSKGAAVFTATLVDSGPVGVQLGDQHRSVPLTFQFTVKERNYAPTFTFVAPTLTVPENARGQPFSLSEHVLATGVSASNPGQRVSFRLDSVSTLVGIFHVNRSTTFEMFDLYRDGENGLLSFRTRQNLNGRFKVTISLRDDGGTANFGEDVTTRSFELVITPASSLPAFTIQTPVLIDEAKTAVLVTIPGAITILTGLAEDEAGQHMSFVAELNGAADAVLFVEPPRFVIRCGEVQPDCAVDMLAVPAANRSGIAHGLVRAVAPTGEFGPEQALEVHIEQVNDAPTFRTVSELAALEQLSAGVEQRVAPAAFDVLPGPYEDEDWQTVCFEVSVATEITGLFESGKHPWMDTHGNLRFTLAPGQHGFASLTVTARDDGGEERGGVSASAPVEISLKIFPLPRVTSVTPRLGAGQGGARVTIAGAYFGSLYSRGFHAANYGNLSVTVGQRECTDVIFISDAALTCTAPAGAGAAEVRVKVVDSSLSRTGVLAHGFVQPQVYLAGVRPAGGAGTLGFAPAHAPLGEAGSLSDVAMSPVASRGVRALAVYGSEVFMGGQFLETLGVRTNYVATWDGRMARPLGHGLDGACLTLVMLGEELVAGGAFSKALQPSGEAIQTGGLAIWDHRAGGGAGAWRAVGCQLDGSVAALAANGTRQLYIGGRFRGACDAASSNVALWVEGSWVSLGSGVAGGEVRALAVAGHVLYAAGSFSSAGGRPAGRVARWEGERWHAAGALDGDVHALAVLGEFLFAAGDFSLADGRPARNVARFSSGRWEAVGGGVDGPGFALLSHGACILLGGAFETCLAPPAEGARAGADIPCAHFASWCPHEESWLAGSNVAVSARQAGVDEEADDSPGPAVVRALAAAVHSHTDTQAQSFCAAGASGGLCI